MGNLKTELIILVAFVLCVNMAYSQIDYTKAKPLAYIMYEDADGNVQKYFGLGKAIKKQDLLNSTGIGASLFDADGLELGVNYRIISFQTQIVGVMSNVELSNGNQFSDKQKAQIKAMTRGVKFFIMRIITRSPDGLDRILPPIEVIIK